MLVKDSAHEFRGGEPPRTTRRVTLIEACVGSLEEALAAEQGGAHRLELCDRLDVGGTTPFASLIDDVKRHVRIPVSIMIRPRGGSFIHTTEELEQMRLDIDIARAHGADMLVIGVLDTDGNADARCTQQLVERAGSTPVTFHRAFDEVADQLEALDVLANAGISRVLTGGGKRTALDGESRLAELVKHARGRLVIMAGGKVRGDVVRRIVDGSGVSEVHARCENDPQRIRDIVNALA